MPKIFISYRRDDSLQVTGRIYDRLVHAFGAENVFKDVNVMNVGKDFSSQIAAALSSAEIIVAVIGKEWVGDGQGQAGGRRIDDPVDYVRAEVEYAIQNREQGIGLVPLAVNGNTLAAIRASNLPESVNELLSYHGVEIHEDPLFDDEIKRLIDQLDHYADEVAAHKAKRAREQADEIARQQRAEREQLRLAAKEVADKAREELQAKEAVIKKQRNPALVLISAALIALFVGASGYWAYLIWSGAFARFGGTLFEVVMIGVFVIVSGFIGLLAAVAIGMSVTSRSLPAALVAAVSVIGAGVLGAIKGDEIHAMSGLIIGVALCVLVGGGVAGFIVAVVLSAGEEGSPWYIKHDARLLITDKEHAHVKKLEAEVGKYSDQELVVAPASPASAQPKTPAATTPLAASAPATPTASTLVAAPSVALAMSDQPLQPGYVRCPNCQYPIKPPVKGNKASAEDRCPYCHDTVFNCRKCGTLLDERLQLQRIEVENSAYGAAQNKLRTLKVHLNADGDFYENTSMRGGSRKADIAELAGNMPEQYFYAEKWLPCPHCGDSDPAGFVQKGHERVGRRWTNVMGSGYTSMVKVFPPRLTLAQQAQQPKPPVVGPRSDGLYIAATAHLKGFRRVYSCLHFSPDNQVAAITEARGTELETAQYAATKVRWDKEEKSTYAINVEEIKLGDPAGGIWSTTSRGDQGTTLRFKVASRRNNSRPEYYVAKDYETSDLMRLDIDYYSPQTGERDRLKYTFVPVALRYF